MKPIEDIVYTDVCNILPGFDAFFVAQSKPNISRKVTLKGIMVMRQDQEEHVQVTTLLAHGSNHTTTSAVKSLKSFPF